MRFFWVVSVGFSDASVLKVEIFENIFWKEKLCLRKFTSREKYILEDFGSKYWWQWRIKAKPKYTHGVDLDSNLFFE